MSLGAPFPELLQPGQQGRNHQQHQQRRQPEPNAIEVAMGIRNCACSEVSNNSGNRPPIVVSEVSSTARTL